MAITLVGQTGVDGQSEASPGPSIAYSSAGGTNTLILTGLVYAGSTAINGITAVTDSADNTWHFSTSNTNNPPSAAEGTSGNWICTFVAWCIGAAAVTSVSVHDGTGHSDFWRLALSEWSGIASADTGAAATGTGSSPGVSLTLANAGDLVVGTANTASGSLNSQPAGWTQFTGSGGAYCAWDLPGSAGSISPAWTLGGSADWAAAIMAFSPPGAHTATASLAVTPSFSASRTRGKSRTASLAVAPAGAASRHRSVTRTAALAVSPSFAAARTAARHRTAALTVTPATSVIATGGNDTHPVLFSAGDPWWKWSAGSARNS